MRAFLFLTGLMVLTSALCQDQVGLTLDQLAARLRRADIELIYSSDRIDPSLLFASPASIEEQLSLLRQVLSARGLALTEVRPDFLVITLKLPVDDPANVVLTGKVRDAVTGQIIVGAIVQVAGAGSSVTDAQGNFLFTDQVSGPIEYRVTAAGYLAALPQPLQLQPDTARFLELSLEPLPFDLEHIMVSASHYNLAWADENQATHLSASDLLSQPSLADDPLRAVNRLPGIASSGLTARSRIRGGGPQETLLVLDDQALADPFHLKGFQSLFSVLNAATLESIDLYTGGFPIEYGNRLSGVVQLSSRQIEAPRLYEIGLGLFESYVLAAGHDQNDDNNYLVSARRGGLDTVLGLLETDFGSPQFSDAYLRFEHRLDSRSKLRLAWLLSRDEIRLNNSGNTESAQANSRDSYLWLSYQRELSDNGSFNLTLTGMSFSGTRSGQLEVPQAVSGELLDRRDSEGFGARATFEKTIHPRWHLRVGAEARQLDASYDYRASSRITGPLGRIDGTLGPANGELSRIVDGLQLGLWTGLRWQATDQLVVESGLRWDDFDYLGVAEEEKFSARFNFFYRPRKGTSLRAAWGQFRQAQGIEELRVEFGEIDFLAPQLAEHSVLSWDQELPRGLALRVEVYQKRVTDPWRQVELLYNPLVLLPDLAFDRVEFDPSSAKARGLEISLRGGSAPLNWWFALTRASVNEQIAGQRVPRSWDQGYAATGGLEWQPGAWTWSLAGNYHAGWPTAMLSQSADGELTSSPRNSQRLGDFVTLDVRASRLFALTHGHLRMYFELSNALNRNNPCCTQYRLDQQGRLQSTPEHWLPLIPSIGLVWSNQ